MTKAELIAAAIEGDIAGRNGIGGEWDAIDDETKLEIRENWTNIAQTILEAG